MLTDATLILWACKHLESQCNVNLGADSQWERYDVRACITTYWLEIIHRSTVNWSPQSCSARCALPRNRSCKRTISPAKDHPHIIMLSLLSPTCWQLPHHSSSSPSYTDISTLTHIQSPSHICNTSPCLTIMFRPRITKRLCEHCQKRHRQLLLLVRCLLSLLTVLEKCCLCGSSFQAKNIVWTRKVVASILDHLGCYQQRDTTRILINFTTFTNNYCHRLRSSSQLRACKVNHQMAWLICSWNYPLLWDLPQVAVL